MPCSREEHALVDHPHGAPVERSTKRFPNETQTNAWHRRCDSRGEKVLAERDQVEKHVLVRRVERDRPARGGDQNQQARHTTSPCVEFVNKKNEVKKGRQAFQQSPPMGMAVLRRRPETLANEFVWCLRIFRRFKNIVLGL